MSTKRKGSIERLKNEVNLHHGSQLNFDQVEYWVGSDTALTTIIDECHEVQNSNGDKGVTPGDILDLWCN